MRYALTMLLALALIGVSPCFAEEGENKEAISAAETWLEKVDGGSYADSWDQAAPYFQQSVAKDAWEKQLSAVRTGLGGVQKRELLSAKPMTELPGAPDGNYVVIQFSTSYENKAKAIETITPMKDQDGQWRVSGYYIR